MKGLRQFKHLNQAASRGRRRRGGMSLCFTQQKITFTQQLGSRPDHKTTHTHTKGLQNNVEQMETNTSLFDLKNVILTHLGDETEEEKNQRLSLQDLVVLKNIFLAKIVTGKISCKSLYKKRILSNYSIRFSLITASWVSLKKEKEVLWL